MFAREKLALLLPGRWDPTLRRSLVVLCAVVAFGTGGYTWIEGWSSWQSLYFTLVTLTTVGYADYGISPAGERFTAVLMIGGIGAVSYAASQIFQYAITNAMQTERTMTKKAKTMRNHHIVCGLGRTGHRIIARIQEEGGTVVAVDASEDAVQAIRLQGIVAICGDATLDDVLNRAGLDHAVSVAAATSSDAANAMICLSARALAPEITIIARAEDESSIPKLQRAGASGVISPACYGGEGMAESMIRPEVARLLFGGMDCDAIKFSQIAVNADSPYCGRTIAQLGQEHPNLVFVAARHRDGTLTMRPGGGHVLVVDDVLVIAGLAPDVVFARKVRRAA